MPDLETRCSNPSRWRWALLAGLLALGASGCVDREAQKQAARTKEIIEDPAILVSVKPVEVRTLQDDLEITGQVTTSSDVTIGARSPGRVVAVFVKDGDPVRAGQVIAEQETTVLRSAVLQAQGQVNAAQAQLQQAITNAKIAPQRSANAVASAEAGLRSAKAQLEKAKQGARDEEVKQAEAQVSTAKFAMETAKKELDRQKELFEGGAVAKARVEQAENAYQSSLGAYQTALENLRMRQAWTRPEDIRSAEEQVRQAEEAVRTAKANQRLDVTLDQQVAAARANVKAAEANLSIAKQNLADAQIRSPFSGRISGNPVQPGTYLAPGSPVARLIGVEGIYFEGEVPESQIAAIAPGLPVRVTVDAVPNRTFAGSVVAVSPSGDQVGRIFRVRIGLAGATDEVKPGMFARGVLTLKSIPNATVVPNSAVIRDADKFYVFTVEGDTAKRRQVTTGLRVNGDLQVVGVPSGSNVVIAGQSQLTDGAKVRIDTGKEAPAEKESGV